MFKIPGLGDNLSFGDQILQWVREIYVDSDYEINVNIQNYAWQLVHKWKINAIRLFTTPVKAELERANQIFSNLEVNRLIMTDAKQGFYRI